MVTRTRPTRWLAIASLAALGAFGTAGCGGDQGASAAEPAPDAANLRTITVVGTGTGAVVPDLVVFQATVHVEGPDATTALGNTAGPVAAVLAAAKAAGVADADVQTTNVNVYPVFRGKPPVPAGYGADHALTVRIHDVAGAGAIVDAVVAAGGPNILFSSLQVTEDDPDKGLDEARKAAIADAQTRAAAMAGAAGSSLGAVRTITETVAGSPSPYPGAKVADSSAAAFAPIAPGTDHPTIQVTVVFDLN